MKSEREVQAEGARLRDAAICREARQAARAAGLMACPASATLLQVAWTPGARGIPQVQDVAAAMHRGASTAGAAWHRAAVRHGVQDEPLAAPGALLYYAWLVRLAAVLEDPRLSLARAAELMGTTPQTLHRSLVLRGGIERPREWRIGRTGRGELATYLRELEPLRPMLADVRLWPRAERPMGLLAAAG